jgi:hypothetical protein
MQLTVEDGEHEGVARYAQQGDEVEDVHLECVSASRLVPLDCSGLVGLEVGGGGASGGIYRLALGTQRGGSHLRLCTIDSDFDSDECTTSAHFHWRYTRVAQHQRRNSYSLGFEFSFLDEPACPNLPLGL